MQIAILIVFGMFLITTCHAFEPQSKNEVCEFAAGKLTCSRSYRYEQPGARIIHVPDEPMTEEQAEHYLLWQLRCKPVETIDKYGVTRLQYAKPGCSSGQWKD